MNSDLGTKVVVDGILEFLGDVKFHFITSEKVAVVTILNIKTKSVFRLT